MFSEYLKPVRSFAVKTSDTSQEIDTHGLMALVKVSENPVCIIGPEDNEYSQDPFVLYPDENFRFSGKIKVKNYDYQSGCLHIMLFDKE